jgi:hypothetical protein
MNVQEQNKIDVKNVCRDFMEKRCKRESCKFIHDTSICVRFWKNGSCKYNENCRKKHIANTFSQKLTKDNTRRKKNRNTESWEPLNVPVDARIVYDVGTDTLTTSLTTRDIVIVPNLFSEWKQGELYTKLISELSSCEVPEKDLLKLWHGNDKIEGTHLICNDRTRWKDSCPTFTMVIERLQKFFNMDIQATRLNWYKDTSQWKPFHHDAAYVNPEKAAVQNFTVAVSFGATRDAAFEHAKTKTVISMPQPDGAVYAFSKDTNGIWRHGILQDDPVRDLGRVSIISWGFIQGMGKVVHDTN